MNRWKIRIYSTDILAVLMLYWSGICLPDDYQKAQILRALTSALMLIPIIDSAKQLLNREYDDPNLPEEKAESTAQAHLLGHGLVLILLLLSMASLAWKKGLFPQVFS